MRNGEICLAINHAVCYLCLLWYTYMQLPVRMIGFMNGLVYCGISTCSCHVRMTGLMHAVMTVKSDSPSIQWPRFANPGSVIKMTTKTTFDHHAAALETSDCIKIQNNSLHWHHI